MENINLNNGILKNMSARYRAIGMLVLAAILWSFGGILIKLVNWNPVAIAGMRSMIAALTILVVLKKPDTRFTFNKVCGAVAYSLTVILFVSANKFTSAANAILLQYSAPIYVAVFGYVFLKEKAALKDWLAIVFVICGMVLFFIDDINQGGLIGNVLAILSGVAFAFTAIFMRKQKNDNPLDSVFWGNIMTGVIGIFFMFTPVKPSFNGWLALVIMGVFQLGTSYIFYSIAIKEVSALEATLIPVIEPVLNPIWVFFVVGEKPGVWAVIGGIIVIASVTANCISKTKTT